MKRGKTQEVDPIFVEVVKGAFAWVCEEMGIVLRNTAYSPNIKERMDHSCAFFLAGGELLAQAEHIPVHLGSLTWGMKRFLEVVDDFDDGDVWIFNNPYISGTHLNDLTAVAPFFFREKLYGFLCVKAHIVDVGGKVPGSISADATEIWQEGFLVPPIRILKAGKIQRDVFELLLSNTRTPEVMRGDVQAMLSALLRGKERVSEIFESYGEGNVVEAGRYAIWQTERKIRRQVSKLDDRKVVVSDTVDIDPDLTIKLTLAVSGDRLRFDFSGSSPQVSLPFNAVEGVTWSAVLFAVKCLFDPQGVPNEGLARAVEIHVPRGSFLNPVPPAPVSGGNLETCQRLADVIFMAFSRFLPDEVPASGQGTMNNVMIGGVRKDGKVWAFYETVGGGAGALKGKDGESAVHVNMTNTMNTPVEAMEVEYPVLFLTHKIRRRSGGRGRWRGGDGIVRAWKLVEGSATLTFVGSRRKAGPPGIFGGESGKAGKQFVVKSGRKVRLPSRASVRLDEGDEFWLFTPGGGGWGKPSR